MFSPADHTEPLHSELAAMIGRHVSPRRVRSCVLIVELEPGLDEAADVCVIAGADVNPAAVSGLIIEAATRYRAAS